MSRLIAICIPIVKGKEAEFRKFTEDLNGRYYNDFAATRKRFNVRERAFHQVMPQAEYVIVTLEGDNPEDAILHMGEGNDDYTRWFVQKVKEIHNFDITRPDEIELPELIADSKTQPTEETQTNNKLIAMAVPITPGKEDEWHEFIEDLRDRYYDDFAASRERLNVRERGYNQVTPEGEVVIVTLEGPNPEEALLHFGEGNDDFTRWFSRKVKEIHNYDLNAPPPFSIPQLVVDSMKQKVKV
ncbi:MAG: hypothetical protein EHM58_01560 [Ignavibacteriae bacterium]|nr:MAG: hypothetical protein EHM58_01560 [Ignavibacteriota bacterium]